MSHLSPDDAPSPSPRDDNVHLVEQEIKYEQSVVDRIHTRLEAAARSARALAAEGHARAHLGNEGGLVERDAIVFQAARRLAAIDAAHDGLVFGRLDLHGGQPRYIGRLGLRDENREVLLVDWRAPAAAVFYQATAQEPLDVVRRRVLQSVGERVVGVQDDLLDADRAPADLVVVGEGALMAALSRSRDNVMHSVVATIQKEQDAAIRAPQRGVTGIVGGPGTGKTVVALHRAAYLLYTDRRRFENGGVLVVGPNRVFMTYIDQVLPSLGETSVSLRALGEVVDGIRATRHDRANVAALKGSARMTSLLARTARGPAPNAPTSFRIFYRDDVLTLSSRQLRSVRRSLLSSGQRRNRAVGAAPDALLDALWEQVSGERALERGKGEFVRTLMGLREFTDFARAWWPVVDAVDVLDWLADRNRLEQDAGGIFTAAELDDLAASFDAAEPTVEDVPLLDELRYLLGEPPEPEPDHDPLEELYDDLVPELATYTSPAPSRASRASDRPTGSVDTDGYAHVLVDEAQDLSPMQWRMLSRRGRAASWTIVGDPAQSAWPFPDEAAAARAEALGRKPEHVFRLSTNYRNSAEIFELAAEVARTGIPDADLPVAVRRTGVAPRLHTVESAELADRVREVGSRLEASVDGTVGVVVPDGWRDRVGDWLSGRDEGRVRVLEALDTKGLEFDAILAVEPDLIAATSAAGTRILYVVLTRATSELDVVGTTTRWLP
ncbi:MAG TPA: UvrD-helicase domain-containing protein [Nocardioidaceae bacterium]|nr:UvrD-helicase domain-containing protein [Nocardioidaceae bacterium]